MKKQPIIDVRQVCWLVLCFALASVPLLLYGQQSVDSLEKVLATKKLTEKERINTYNDLARKYSNLNTQKSLNYAKLGLALARKVGDRKMEAHFYQNIGGAYTDLLVHDSASIYLEKALSIAQELEIEELEASIYHHYGVLSQMQSRYDSSLGYYQKAATIYERNEDLERLGKAYAHIGATYQVLSNFEQALIYFTKAEKLAEETNDKAGLAAIYISLGDIYLYQGKEKEKSLYYAENAVKIYREVGDNYLENFALQAFAKVYAFHQDYEAALPIIQQAANKAEELGFPQLIATSSSILSSVQYYTKQYDASVESAVRSLEADSAYANTKLSAYSNLAKSYAYIGHPDSTEKYFNLYSEVSGAYSNETFQNSLSNLEIKYETEKKELKIEALEKQRQLYTWLGIAGAVILLIALAFAVIRYRLAVSKRKLAEEETQRLEQEKQLVAVQATLDGEAAERTRLAKDLHDGLGSMLSLVKFNLPQMNGGAALEAVDVSRFQKALGMLDESIQELRRVAHHMMPESLLRYGLKVSLSDFCAAIPIANFHYFGDETRLSEKLEIMIYRCIHELVNNALKHAQANHVNVQLVQEEDRISFTVQDDGIGFNQEQVTEGMGLNNVRQRVEAFQGELNIYSSEQGTEVHVELKLTKSDEND